MMPEDDGCLCQWDEAVCIRVSPVCPLHGSPREEWPTERIEGLAWETWQAALIFQGSGEPNREYFDSWWGHFYGDGEELAAGTSAHPGTGQPKGTGEMSTLGGSSPKALEIGSDSPACESREARRHEEVVDGFARYVGSDTTHGRNYRFRTDITKGAVSSWRPARLLIRAKP